MREAALILLGILAVWALVDAATYEPVPIENDPYYNRAVHEPTPIPGGTL